MPDRPTLEESLLRMLAEHADYASNAQALLAGANALSENAALRAALRELLAADEVAEQRWETYSSARNQPGAFASEIIKALAADDYAAATRLERAFDAAHALLGGTHA